MSALINDPGLGALGRSRGNNAFSLPSIKLPGNIILYILGLLILFIIVNMLMNKNISFDFLKNLLPAKYRATIDSALYFKPGPQFTNLKAEGNSDVSDNLFSINVDCILYDSRSYSTTDGPYRHILHRGSAELEATTVGGIVTTGCSRILRNDNLPLYGLPKRMNPGIFLDRNTNDVILFVDTESGIDVFRESVRIPDIPLNKPFRLGVIVHNQVLEVYLNCRLEVTRILAGAPKRVENIWYGLSGSAAAQAQIQNLYVWKRAISAEDIRPLCPAPPTFNAKRPICNSADEVVKKDATDKTNTINLGLGASLRTC